MTNWSYGLRGLLLGSISMLLGIGCKPPQLVKRNFKATPICIGKTDTEVQPDSAIEALLIPYRAVVHSNMQRVIGYSCSTLVKEQPEGTLGDFVADALYEECAELHSGKLDFAVCNYGGLRINSMPEGNITLGKLFELMPFDNFLVAIEIDGSTLQTFLDHCASQGGWPVSHQVHYRISNKKATDVTIHGKALEPDKVYVMATSNYLTDGNDNCGMLKSFKPVYLNKLIRDALVAYVEKKTTHHSALDFVKDGRITR